MEANYGMALANLNLKEYKMADKILSDFLDSNRQYVKDDRVLLIGGIIDYYLERYESAAQKLNTVKSSETAYYYLGQSFLKLNKYTDAANAFKKVYEEFPAGKYAESALYNKAEAFFKGENFTVAAGDYQNYAKRYPDSKLASYADFKMASSLFNYGKFDDAIAAYKKVVLTGSDPKLKAFAQYLMGEAYLNKKDFIKAAEAYDTVMTQYQTQYEAVGAAALKAGWCNIRQGKYDKAVAALTEFTSKYMTSDNIALGYYLLGNSYYLKGDYSTPINDYQFILDKFKYSDLSEAALLMIELCYTNQKQYQQLITTAANLLDVMSSKFQSSKSKLRSRSYFYLGLAYYDIGMFGPAASAFQQIIDKYYDSDITTEARANLAWCYYQLGQYSLARRMATDVAESDYANKKIKAACEILVGHTYFSEKNYTKGAAKYGEFALNHEKDKDIDPNQMAEALYQQGEIYYIQEYYMDAIKSWQVLVGKYPKAKRAPDALYKISDTYFKAQKYDEAISGFEMIIKKWPDLPVAEDAMFEIAQVYYNSDKEDKAIAAFKQFTEKYPNSPKAKNGIEGLQTAYFKKGEKNQDPETLLAFVDKYPNSNLAVDALYKAGEIYFQSQKFQKAIDVFNRLSSEHPNDTLATNASYYLAACYEGLQKTDDAIEAYKTFLKNFPKHELASDVMFRLATALYNAKRYTDAIFYYEKTIEKYPGTDYAKNSLFNAALCYSELNKMDEAITDYKAYAQKYKDDPKSKDIPGQIASTYLTQKRYKEAIDAYTEIAKSTTGTADDAKAEAWYRVGDIYKTMEQTDAAITAFRNLIDVKPANNQFRVSALIAMAQLYEDKQDWKNAVAIYQYIASSGAQKDYTDGATSRISDIKAAYPDAFKEKAPASNTGQK
jgi:TolA-binding protein